MHCTSVLSLCFNVWRCSGDDRARMKICAYKRDNGLKTREIFSHCIQHTSFDVFAYFWHIAVAIVRFLLVSVRFWCSVCCSDYDGDDGIECERKMKREKNSSRNIFHRYSASFKIHEPIRIHNLHIETMRNGINEVLLRFWSFRFFGVLILSFQCLIAHGQPPKQYYIEFGAVFCILHFLTTFSMCT